MNENVTKNLDEALNAVLVRTMLEAKVAPVAAHEVMQLAQAAANLANASATLAQRDMLLAGKL